MMIVRAETIVGGRLTPSPPSSKRKKLNNNGTKSCTLTQIVVTCAVRTSMMHIHTEHMYIVGTMLRLGRVQ